MQCEAQVSIDAPKETVWAEITDIEGFAGSLSGVDSIEILERPASGFVGLKWRETRTLMGKAATEDMWITEAVENEHYTYRAESHGFIYICTLRIAEQGGGCTVTKTHHSQATGFGAKLMSIPMTLFFKGMLRKALVKDLEDHKASAERRASS